MPKRTYRAKSVIPTVKRRGRPPGFDKERARIRLREMVWANMDAMAEAQIAHAKGVKYLVARQKKGGKFVTLSPALAEAIIKGEDDQHEMLEVWEKDPSVQAFTDLMNRTLDKPAETQNVTIDGTLTLGIEGRLKAARERLAKAKRGNGKPHA